MNETRDTLLREQAAFLARPPETLRQCRGRELYETLSALGLTHGQFLRALGTTLEEYCAAELGVDLSRVTVERFFQSDPAARWLFPEIVRGAVLEGVRARPRHPELIFRDEPVTGAAVDLPRVVEDAGEEELRTVAEGAAIPEATLRYGDRVFRLRKLGRGLLASYEATRRMSVDMLRLHLRRMGERLGLDLDARLATLLAQGHPEYPDTAPQVLHTATPGTFTYDDLLAAYAQLRLGNGFTPTHLVCDAGTLCALMALEPLRNPMVSDFDRTGRWPSPLGITLVPITGHPATCFTLLDARHAAVKLTEQDVLVENEKLIARQWERICVTVVTDFAIAYEKARVVVSAAAP